MWLSPSDWNVSPCLALRIPQIANPGAYRSYGGRFQASIFQVFSAQRQCRDVLLRLHSPAGLQRAVRSTAEALNPRKKAEEITVFLTSFNPAFCYGLDGFSLIKMPTAPILIP